MVAQCELAEKGLDERAGERPRASERDHQRPSRLRVRVVRLRFRATESYHGLEV